ncbi:hypothetical protein F383_36422 [Gossypium arboreum]|uniref:Uncharacterized protein n=1 Tax=Gossypium arboreum TaxID=29729 RepID=A0A0B0N1Q8_GOSAR|nr:hypothetical protein F383_32357 [Gossypium arboreum]KHG06527.1 hypothetical protein F383_33077 [Gossypium arboreum]KHG12297.1 hypothetical protein F383_19913 [Gossypium arboreum]KHG18278.1 hypothetical protein F383_23582 [Gossypium arboreum]KHG19276.1 hypothetical protein F383_23875 [Gossypium arboreum]
MLTPLLWLLVF